VQRHKAGEEAPSLRSGETPAQRPKASAEARREEEQGWGTTQSETPEEYLQEWHQRLQEECPESGRWPKPEERPKPEDGARPEEE
jgi:hypothetical protein